MTDYVGEPPSLGILGGLSFIVVSLSVLVTLFALVFYQFTHDELYTLVLAYGSLGVISGAGLGFLGWILKI